MTMHRKKGIFRSCCGLLICLLLSVLVAVEWAATGFCENEAPERNSSGNPNYALSVDPIRKSEGYSAVLYDNRNGLLTTDVTAITQTSDGFIWIGSYAGLSRYDGSTFEHIASSTGIAAVRCLFVDSLDRLWIGTNDSGVFLMTKGSLRNWNKNDGLKSASIRAIAEDMEGSIYIASTAGIATIDADLNLTVLEDERVSGATIEEIRLGGDGLIYGLTQEGDLFTTKDGLLLSFLRHWDCRVKGIISILPDPDHPGDLYLGADDGRVYRGNLEHNFSSLGIKDISPLSLVWHFEYINGQIWICADNGIGRLDAEGFHSLKNVPLNSSVGHVMTDYEGNLWFTSSKQGVMKIVPNRFTDLFERYNLPAAIVNSTCMYDDQLFIGTDTGLVVVDNGKAIQSIPLTKAVTASGKELGTTDLLELLDGVRIRSIIRDSKNQLWISTWLKCGLIRYARGEVTAFTPEDGLFSERVRTVCECEDGSILVSNTGGVSIILDDRVVACFGEADGIKNTVILTVTEGFNHELIFGSDGDGIYIFNNGETKHLNTEDGLSSEIIMRIKRSLSRDIYWIVTGNSLAYMTSDYKVTTIRDFPYPDNFDLYENSTGDLWILTSAGIYVVSAEALLANESIDPILHSISNGLPYIATANSFSELTAQGDLYIASKAGVVKVNIEEPFENISNLKISLPYIEADGARIYPNLSGSFVLPGNVRKLTIFPHVFNYSLINPLVSYHLDGFETKDKTVRRGELAPVDYTNLKSGTYHFKMQVKDPIGHVDKTVSFQIIKEKKMSEDTAGSIIMDASALFFLCGILIYSASYRKRGRLDDRLFFAMIHVAIILSVTDMMSYLQEGTSLSAARELMIAENTIFFAAFELCPYLFFLYMDYLVYRDPERINKIKIPYGIPCFLTFVIILINLKTGWVFSITSGNIWKPGPVFHLFSVPMLFYFLLSLAKAYKINIRLVLLGILIISARLVWDLWIRSISSTAFTYTLFLVCMHIYVTNRPLTEDKA